MPWGKRTPSWSVPKPKSAPSSGWVQGAKNVFAGNTSSAPPQANAGYILGNQAMQQFGAPAQDESVYGFDYGSGGGGGGGGGGYGSGSAAGEDPALVAYRRDKLQKQLETDQGNYNYDISSLDNSYGVWGEQNDAAQTDISGQQAVRPAQYGLENYDINAAEGEENLLGANTFQQLAQNTEKEKFGLQQYADEWRRQQRQNMGQNAAMGAITSQGARDQTEGQAAQLLNAWKTAGWNLDDIRRQGSEFTLQHNNKMGRFAPQRDLSNKQYYADMANLQKQREVQNAQDAAKGRQYNQDKGRAGNNLSFETWDTLEQQKLIDQGLA